MTMSSIDERPALALGGLVLFGLAILTAAVPIVGYVLLALVLLAVLALVGGFVALWWQTRWQPLDDQDRPIPVPTIQDREVA
jgi:VIT1/CCC1 family predicted Fe2+/Mn2+ transporter